MMILRQEILSNDGSSKSRRFILIELIFMRTCPLLTKQRFMLFNEKGCRYLQFDDTNWAFLADQTKREALLQKGIDPERNGPYLYRIINNALEDKPEDLTITTHICRGNPRFFLAVFPVDMNPLQKSCFQQQL